MRKCGKSWIDFYMKYTENQESPKAFHKWVAISVISSALQRRVWIPRVKYTIYPNLFVVLVAGSAKCRKSVSISIGRDLIYGMESVPPIFAQKITTEALIEALSNSTVDDSCYGLILASEFSVFLGSDAMKSGIIPALTDLYDSPREWTYHTRGRGKEVLHNVTLSMLAASTKDWIKTSIPDEAIGGGFTSRVVFVFEDSPSKLILFPMEDRSEADQKTKLIADLNHITNLKGEVKFDAKAREVAMEWYEDNASIIHEDKTDGYFGRKHDTMFKISTILSVAETDSLVVKKEHVEEALKLLNDNEKQLNTVLEGVTANVFGGNTDKILTIIKKHGKMNHSDLLKKCWRYASAADLVEIMKTLTESGEVEQWLDSNNIRWYKRKV